MNKVSTTVYLGADQAEALADIQRKTGIPRSVMIRRGVDLAIDWYEQWLEEREDMESKR